MGTIPVLQAISPMVPAGTKSGAVLGALLAIVTIIMRIRAKQPLGPVIDVTIAKAVDAVHELQGIAPPSVVKVDEVTAIVKNQPGALNAKAG